jgi:eukaryotic-like serine/threonine-protein kinase
MPDGRPSLVSRSLPSTGRRSKYRILGKVGQGQYAPVFCGFDRQAQRLVAMKRIDVQRFPTQRFLHELHLLTRLQHPNIVQFHTIDYSDQGRHLITDYCAGGTLRDLMESGVPLRLTEVLQLVIDILRGLVHAHEVGIVHCDLKPENILLVPEAAGWTAQIGDFGVSRLVEPGAERHNDDPFGSPAYRAPECHYHHYSFASDQYAVGVLLFELLVGDRPFSGTPGALMNAHLNQKLALPDAIPFSLRSIITTALQKLPKRRFASTEAMLKSVSLAAEIIRLTSPTEIVPLALTMEALPQLPAAFKADEDFSTVTIAPDECWGAVITADQTLEIFSLPGVRSCGGHDWRQVEQVVALDHRYGLAVLANDDDDNYRTWRLFNRKGGFIDYCRLPATIGPLQVVPDRSHCVMAIDTGNPAIAFMIDLKPLRVQRVSLNPAGVQSPTLPSDYSLD